MTAATAAATAAFDYFSRMTDQFFETTMRRAADRICARQHFFPHRAP
jgi:hypothetical protein